MKNKVANFWIRLITRIFDIFIVYFISILTAFFLIEKKEIWEFKKNIYFYFWCLEFILLNFVWFILIPLKNGQTLFMYFFRIKIVFQKNKFYSIIKREAFFSIGWIIIMFLFMIVINKDLVSKYILNIKQNIKYTNLEKIRINFFTTISGIIIFIQFIEIISIILKKNKIGMQDNFSNTKTIWKNKYIKINKKNKIEIRPRQVQNIPIEWLK